MKIVGALLVLVLTSALSSATAAAADPISEVAAAASSVAAPVTASAPVSPAPASADPAATAAAAPTPAAAPAPDPVRAVTAVAKSTATAVAGSADRTAKTAGTVVESSGVNQVPVVADTVRRGGEVADSLVDTVAAAGPQHAQAPEKASPSSDGGTVEPAPRQDKVGPNPSAPEVAADAFPAPAGREGAGRATSRHAHAFGLALDRHRAPTGGSAFPAPLPTSQEHGGPTPTGSRTLPSLPFSPPPSFAASASVPGGGGFGTSLLLLGLLAGFALAAPRTAPRLLRAAASYRPAPFICALERPG